VSPADITIETERRTVQDRSVFRGADRWIYMSIVVCIFAESVLGPYRGSADPVAYLDISDLIRRHAWHAVVNAYWFPLYPAALALGRAAFGFRVRYELLAAKLVDSIIQVLFVVSSVFLAATARRLMLARGFSATELLPRRTLYIWIATIACFFALRDFTGITPDALLTMLMIVSVAFLLRGVTEEGWLSFLIAGLSAGVAFWTKAFAFPFFFLCIFCFGVANFRHPRILRGLVFSLLIFGFISAPWVWQLSQAKGRFSAGDSGSLNAAWFVNGADRFNPVPDLSVYHAGQAVPDFKHPGELLMRDPEISYYNPHTVPGSTPQWDDPSYWSDRLKPRFVPRQYATEFVNDMKVFLRNAPMRLQVVVLLAVFPLFGFVPAKRAIAYSPFSTVLVLAVAVVGSYLLIYFEQRYVIFSYIAIATIYAACCLRRPSSKPGSLHTAVLLIAALVVLYGFQESLQKLKDQQLEGGRPLHGIYDVAATSAGASLASEFPPGSEVACMGDAACWGDPYWARYGHLEMTAIVETGRGFAITDAQTGCVELRSHPDGMRLLRNRNVRAIVGRFEEGPPCSTQWKPLGRSGTFYYLPL
jgi:hypothetical protein